MAEPPPITGVITERRAKPELSEEVALVAHNTQVLTEQGLGVAEMVAETLAKIEERLDIHSRDIAFHGEAIAAHGETLTAIKPMLAALAKNLACETKARNDMLRANHEGEERSKERHEQTMATTASLQQVLALMSGRIEALAAHHDEDIGKTEAAIEKQGKTQGAWTGAVFKIAALTFLLGVGIANFDKLVQILAILKP